MADKKRVLIVSHALELGGAERSLIGLLDALEICGYNIDLFLLRQEGELMKDIPSYINVLPVKSAYTVLARPMIDTLCEGHFILTFARVLGKIAAKIYDKKNKFDDSCVSIEYSHKFTCPFMPPINEKMEYDLAISFLTPHYFVARKVKAKKKIAWIHTDYSKVQVNVQSEFKMWNAYDYIASISDAVTISFLKVFPKLKNKVILIENILPEQYIRKKANEVDIQNEMPQKGIRLLSVGRYCVAKNFDNIPSICAKLVNENVDIYWYIIGFGGDEELIRKKIIEMGMEKRVILLGKKENPYPYIKSCDLYVQPSRYEGKCVTVREAQMLGKPVLITNYSTAESQLENGIDGIIAPLDNERCANEIKKLLSDEKLLVDLMQTCRTRDYSNKEEIKKIQSILKN